MTPSPLRSAPLPGGTAGWPHFGEHPGKISAAHDAVVIKVGFALGCDLAVFKKEGNELLLGPIHAVSGRATKMNDTAIEVGVLEDALTDGFTGTGQLRPRHTPGSVRSRMSPVERL